ncbi:unnamed protein product [Lactuca virosa]|uniref:Uncharacterized protein n=1 Tax=Lactuca virosa TaxID=75947 RepID=A0AAU9LR94_9ASTR|nr:unnamed protein product [Lactuca virosa]
MVPPTSDDLFRCFRSETVSSELRSFTMLRVSECDVQKLKNFKVYKKGGKTIVFTQTKRDADEVSLI